MGDTGTMALVALAALLWGANFNLAGWVVAELHPLTAAAGRFAIAALVMLMLAAARGERVRLLRHAGPYAMLGLVGIAGFNLPFFLAMKSTSAVNGALIMATNPLLTALLAALLLGERPSRRQWLALPVALGGVAAVVLGDGGGFGLADGDALIILANLLWAAYNLLGRRLMPKESGLANTAGIMVMGALALSLAAWLADAPATLPGVGGGAALATMAVGGSALAYLFWNAGLARLGAGRTALFLNLVPVATMLIAATTGTPPSALQLGGGAVVLLAVSAAMLPAPARFRLRRRESSAPISDAFPLSPSEAADQLPPMKRSA